ncbi:MAG: SDR family oxidoreductase, partial [Desulfobacterales bacterium]
MNKIGDSLLGKRVLITQCQDFMGPVICDTFSEYGAKVIADKEILAAPGAAEAVVARAGSIDILVANLSIQAPRTFVQDVTDAEWRHVFAHLVDPLPRLFRAVLPGMIERQSGKIVVIGSASALKGMKRASTYSAARGAQISYVRAAGVEVAKHNVQI